MTHFKIGHIEIDIKGYNLAIEIFYLGPISVIILPRPLSSICDINILRMK